MFKYRVKYGRKAAIDLSNLSLTIKSTCERIQELQQVVLDDRLIRWPEEFIEHKEEKPWKRQKQAFKRIFNKIEAGNYKKKPLTKKQRKRRVRKAKK